MPCLPKCRRAVQLAAGSEPPVDCARLGGPPVEGCVVGADEDTFARNHWRRLNLGAGLELPDVFTILGVYRVKGAAQIADKNQAMIDRGGRLFNAFLDVVFPAQLSGVQIQR